MIDFNDCWQDDATNTVDALIDRGRVVLYGYWEDINGAFYAFPETSVQEVYFTRTEEDAGGMPVPLQTVKADSFGSDYKTGFVIILTPDTSGIINITNMVSLGETAFTALTMPREIGDFVIEQFLSVIDDGNLDDLCNAGGSASYTLNPISLPIATGHEMTVTFNSCVVDSGIETVTYNGTYSASVDNLIGQLSSATDYNTSISISPMNVNVTDDVGTSNISGAMRFIRQASSGNFTETALSLSAPLTTTENGETISFDSFSISSSLSASGAYSFGSAGESVVISHSAYADNLFLDIVLPIQGNALSAPYQGNLNLTAPDDSALSTSINNGVVYMEVDSDGDGIADGTLVRDWEDFD